jgi:hypothetical protein
MRDDGRVRADVLDYIAAENAYAASRLAPLARLAGALADEMDAPLPAVEWRPPRASGGGWEYAERRGPRDDQWDVFRRPAAAAAAKAAGAPAKGAPRGGRRLGAAGPHSGSGSGGNASSAAWRRVGPFNRLAAGRRYFDVAAWAPSPDGAWLAFALDTRGDEEYSVYVIPIVEGAAAAAGGDGDSEEEGTSGGSEGDSESDGSRSGSQSSSGSGSGGGAWRGPAAPRLVVRGAAGGGQLVWAPGGGALFVLDQPGSFERQGAAETRVVRHAVPPPATDADGSGGSGSGRGESGSESESDSSGSGRARRASGSGGRPQGVALLRLAPGALDLELSASSSGEFLMLKYSAAVRWGVGGGRGLWVQRRPGNGTLWFWGWHYRSKGGPEKPMACWQHQPNP